jgi:hypothetical protein
MIHGRQSHVIPLISRPVSHVSRDESKPCHSFVWLAVSLDWNVQWEGVCVSCAASGPEKRAEYFAQCAGG